MIVKALAVGPIMANCYILGCEETRHAAVIDPGDEADRILMSLTEDKLNVKYILNTHGHFDHVGANKRLKEVTGAKIAIHPDDAEMLDMINVAAASFGMAAENSPPPDLLINDGDKITFGNITLEVLHTPGHSLGGVSFFSDGVVFVGDTLFAGSIGRTDFPGGDFNTLISSVKNKLFVMPDEVKVLTGHGPATTIGQEKRTNPFFR